MMVRTHCDTVKPAMREPEKSLAYYQQALVARMEGFEPPTPGSEDR